MSIVFIDILQPHIKKESPNEGTETSNNNLLFTGGSTEIKKESPNEGTETPEEKERKRLINA